MTDLPQPTIKGTILRSLLKFLETDLTPDQRARMMANLSESDRALTDPKMILSTQKVPELTLNHLTVEAAKVKGESLESFGRRAGRAEIADAVGVYRFLTLVLTPAALLHKASALWATVHSDGKLTIEHEEPGGATVVLTGFPSEAAHCARLAGWFEGAGELTRSKNTRVTHDLCLTRGADRCRWQLTWQK
jgi:hypothetical protein